MKHFLNLCLLMLTGILCLFFIEPDIQYVFSFLMTLIFYCLTRIITRDFLLYLLCICGFFSVLFYAEFFCFYPVFFYMLFLKKQYLPAILGGISFLMIVRMHLFPYPVLILVCFGTLLAFYLQYMTTHYET